MPAAAPRALLLLPRPAGLYSPIAWLAYQTSRRRGRMRGSLSGNLATMCPGLPYAVGARFVEPGRSAVALVGDGAMQMNGINELISVEQFRREWATRASWSRC